MKKVVEVVKEHAEIFWSYDAAKKDEIELTKIDVACDMKGAFMPGLDRDIYEAIKRSLSNTVDDIFETYGSNFLSLFSGLNFQVERGYNILNSCYQYIVKDGDG